jgi:hypothetical protein
MTKASNPQRSEPALISDLDREAEHGGPALVLSGVQTQPRPNWERS